MSTQEAMIPAPWRPRRPCRIAARAALLACALVLALACQAQAAPGDLDSSFSFDGKQRTDFAGGQDDGRGVAAQADGKIVVAGSVGGDFALARYNVDGTLDRSFSGGGKQRTDFAGGQDDGRGVAAQDDGKIIVVGTTGGDFALARYNADGTLDGSFSGDGKQTADFAGSSDEGQAVAVQADGRIVVAGLSEQGATGIDFALARYNVDGTLDGSFGVGGKRTTDFETDFGNSDRSGAVAVQADGKIVVAGTAGALVNGPTDFALARYDADGSLDRSFSGDGKQRTDFAGNFDWAGAVAVQAGGKIVVAGGSGMEAGRMNPDPTQAFALARYNTDGSLDRSFSGDGKQTTDFAGRSHGGRAVAIQADGKVVVAGSAGGDFALARYNVDGSLDGSFSGDGRQTTDFAGREDVGGAVAVQADGKIVVAGTSDDDFALARYRGEGGPPGGHPPPAAPPERGYPPIDRLGGTSVWSMREGGRYFLVADHGGSTERLAIASRGVPFDVDLGPDEDGDVVAAYSRCEKEPEVPDITSRLYSTPVAAYSTGEGCDVYRYDFASLKESRLAGASTAQASEFLPSIWRDEVAFGRVYERRAGSGGIYPYLYVRAAAGGRSDRQPGGSRGLTGLPGPTSVDLYGRRLSFVWNYAPRASDQGTETDDEGTTEVRLDTVGGDHRVLSDSDFGAGTYASFLTPKGSNGRITYGYQRVAALERDDGPRSLSSILLRYRISNGDRRLADPPEGVLASSTVDDQQLLIHVPERFGPAPSGQILRPAVSDFVD